MKRIAVGLLCAAFGCGGEDGEARGGGVRVWRCDETRVRELIHLGNQPSGAEPAFVHPRPNCNGGYAVIPTVSADGGEGALTLVDLTTFTVREGFLPASPDAVVRHADERLYVLNRSGDDTIQVHDTADDFRAIGSAFSVADEGGPAEPQDICCASREQCYVLRGEDPEILVVNPEEDGAVLGKIDLTTQADPEPRPRACFIAGSRLVVAQQQVFTFIDLLVDPPAILLTLTAASPNPRGHFVPVSPTEALIVETGEDHANDGSLELIEAAMRVSLGVKLTEEALGGDLAGVARCSAEGTWVIGSDATGHGELRAVDLANETEPATVRRPLYEADGDRLTAVGADACRRIWVVDRDP